MVDKRIVAFEREDSAFQELLSTTRTILTLASGILIGLIGFIATKNPPQYPFVGFLLLSVAVVVCLFVMLQGLTDIVHDRAKIFRAIYRVSYVVILLTFGFGFLASASYILRI